MNLYTVDTSTRNFRAGGEKTKIKATEINKIFI